MPALSSKTNHLKISISVGYNKTVTFINIKAISTACRQKVFQGPYISVPKPYSPPPPFPNIYFFSPTVLCLCVLLTYHVLLILLLVLHIFYHSSLIFPLFSPFFFFVYFPPFISSLFSKIFLQITAAHIWGGGGAYFPIYR
jgi:hypothetical protein